jgi:lipopolysaccharide/colanic/teichoic acid biosynthesis glycosyltransferase
MRRAAGVLCAAGSFALVWLLAWFHATRIDDYPVLGTARAPWIGLLSVMVVLAAYSLGLPDGPTNRRRALLVSLASLALPLVAVSGLQLVVGQPLLPRFVALGMLLVVPPWHLLCWNLAHDGRQRSEDRERVLLIVSSSDGGPLRRDLEADLSGRAERPARVVGSIDVDRARPRSAGDAPIAREAERTDATLVVLDLAAQDDPDVVHQVAALHAAGVRVRTLSMFSEQWLGKLPVAELERVSMLFDIGELHNAPYVRARRVVDVALSLVGLVALALAVPVVAVGDLVANRGPLFFTQERIGRDGRPFRLLKFRTMRPESDGDRPDDQPFRWTAVDDDRITPFGGLLRRFHVDELPQMLAVLRGDLSIVGPRPEQPAYVEELRRKLPYYDVRHLVRPGLTGWAQVKYGYSADDQDAREKLQYELYYLRHQGLALDLRIVGRTFRHISSGGGR